MPDYNAAPPRAACLMRALSGSLAFSASRLLLSLVVLCAACATPVPPPDPLPNNPFANEIAAFERADETQAPIACRTLFVGSSSIRLWTSLAEDLAPLTVINRGFGGSTIADVNRYFEETVARHHPRAIIFYAGENDIDVGAAPQAVVAAFRTFMGLKRRALGPTPVYFISLKPSRARWGQLAAQHQVNQAIARMANRAEDLIYIDVASDMMVDGALREIYVDDGLHMNAAGYAIWTRAVRAALDAPAPTLAPGC